MNEEDLPGIEDFEKWVHKTAWKYSSPNNSDFPDIVQELRIGIWRGMQSYESGRIKNMDDDFSERDAFVGWVTQRAEWHLMKLKDTQRWTGLPSRSGTPLVEYDPRYALPFSTIGSRHEEEGYEEDSYIEHRIFRPIYADEFESVETSAHLPDIVSAINELTPKQRKYVYGVFWNDEKIESAVGGSYSVKATAHRQLFHKLSHLKSMVLEDA